MATKTKLKSAAALATPQSRESVQNDIKELGDLQRELERKRADMNDTIAEVTRITAPRMDDLSKRITALQTGIQTWCEANREELCGKGKTANLITGEVSWRQRPPSVGIRSIADVIERLRRVGLIRFIRIKEELNKDAMLNEPDVVRDIPGITISTGVEDFIIAPFEVEASA